MEWNRMEWGLWNQGRRVAYNLVDAVSRSTVQVKL